MLTPLQREVAEILAGLDEASDFGLAGGAALIIHKEIARSTRDLDFFGPHHTNVEALDPAAEDALRATGFHVDRIRDGSGFARLEAPSPRRPPAQSDSGTGPDARS